MAEVNKPFFIHVALSPHSALNFGTLTGNKSRPVFTIPPPTTLIGALSYPLARIEGSPESGRRYMPAVLAGILMGVYMRLDGPAIPYATITKMWFYDPDDKLVKSDAYGYQRLYVKPKWRGGPTIKAVYIFDGVKARKELGDRWREKLVASATTMVRLGDKESLVSVDQVSYGEAEILYLDEVVTRYTVPLNDALLIEPVERWQELKVYEFYDWRKLKGPDITELPTTKVVFAYDRRNFLAGGLKVRNRNAGKLKAYKLKVGEEVEHVVAW
ncbi:CRISPR-associated protein Cas5 [Desulfurococcus mucosus]|uniref:CRISPR-associated protein Cas5 family n=1 Tax=Desulfurococcus mucosus (strain ATCC 35584 / DSM 2162 / JCM 9187 / O7/1) TaxID=765177 RepID=E8R9X1_DESM0|nr:CRISPR-associated protein Cas5 [Desulfurococcus mucosus]ADV65297.1 CRISPR-associated protein Cas5 family [Desulfurococcus mucosus DSM 2162]